MDFLVEAFEGVVDTRAESVQAGLLEYGEGPNLFAGQAHGQGVAIVEDAIASTALVAQGRSEVFGVAENSLNLALGELDLSG